MWQAYVLHEILTRNGNQKAEEISNQFSWMKHFYFDSNLNLICSQGPIQKPTSIQVLDRGRACDKPSSEPMTAYFTNK